MKLSLAVCLLICISIFFTGCTSNVVTTQPTIQSTQAVVSSIPATVSIMVITSPTITPSTTAPITTENTTAPVVMYSTQEAIASDPLINNFQFYMSDATVSDCVMKQIFPDIGNNANYGLNAIPPYLIGLSSTKVNSYISDYNTGKNVGQSGSISSVNCQNIPMTKSNTWHFEEVTAKFTPRNARPSGYMIILNVYSNGKIVSQITTNQTLTMDQPVDIDTMIPLKGTDTVNSVTINFNRSTEN